MVGCVRRVFLCVVTFRGEGRQKGVLEGVVNRRCYRVCVVGGGLVGRVCHLPGGKSSCTARMRAPTATEISWYLQQESEAGMRGRM